MYNLEVVITIAAIAFVIGIVGTIFVQRKGFAANSQREMEQHLNEMQKQQQSYQQEVTEHFAQTAALLDQLSESYRDVHNHLAQGAHKLAGDAARSKLSMLPEPSAKDGEPSEEELRHITPPLDYAPKSASGIGVLNEAFSLDDDDEMEDMDEKPNPRHVSKR